MISRGPAFHKKHRIRNRKEWLENLERTVTETFSAMEDRRQKEQPGSALTDDEAGLLAHRLAKHYRLKYHVPGGISFSETESVIKNAILGAIKANAGGVA